jgi:hypothetical protein
MATERIVERLDSVFDLRIHRALNLLESVSTRVMLTYSKTENRKKFKVLSPKATDDMKRKITSWLDTHIDVNALACYLGQEEIDMDSFPRASGA